MKKKKINPLVFKNRKVYFDFDILEKIESGIILNGTEIKSIRNSKVNINGSFGIFIDDELYIRGIDIAPYEEGSYNNHEPKRDRKLLLHKKQLNKLKVKLEEKGLTIVPTKLYSNERGIIKLEIGVARGKKNYDKKNAIYDREEKIRIKRDFNINI